MRGSIGRWLGAVAQAIAVVLAFVGAPTEALAQAPTAATARSSTDAAVARLAAAERDRAARASSHDARAKVYATQLRAVDALKRLRASWRRDRQLRDQLATSEQTARQLPTLAQAVTTAEQAVARARAQVVVAIDAEAAVARGGRVTQLASLRRRHAPAPAAVPARRLILPDGALDPLADPEELDQQALLLRGAEADLARVIATLDHQASTLRRAATLRAAHDRAGDLAQRDDEGPRRQSASGGSGAETAGAPDPDDGPTGTAFAGEQTALVLRDVVDAPTGEALRRADRGSDPATKAEAATRARAQAAARLAALAAQRAAIEARARELRR